MGSPALVWRWFHGGFDARALPFTALVLGLAAVSFAAGRRLSRDAVPAESSKE